MDNKKIASHGKRIINYVIDVFFEFLVFCVLAFIFSYVLIVSGGPKISAEKKKFRFIAYLMLFMGTFLYCFVMESLWGKTVGKMVTHTKVVDENGNAPSMGRIFIRTLSRFIPFEAFSFLRAEPVGWHDSISKTRVVNK